MLEFETDNVVFILAFLSIFHILGGGALGVALRAVRTRPAGTRGCGVNLGLVIWGLMFGGFPLLMGLAAPILLPLQMLEIVVAFLVTFFFWDRIRDLFAKSNVMLALFGGIFFTVGCSAAGFLIKQKEWLMALLFGGLCGGLGAVILVLGIKQTLNPPADEDG